MKKLYETLTEVLIQRGFDVATWGEDEEQPESRTLRLEVIEQAQIAPSFDMFEATFTVVFLQGDWATNAANLSDALTTLIPVEDRPDAESRSLPDNSDKLTLLDIPQFSEITVEYNEDTAEEEHSVMVSIHYS